MAQEENKRQSAAGDADVYLAIKGMCQWALGYDAMRREAVWREDCEWVDDAPRPLQDGDASKACVALNARGMKCKIGVCMTALKHLAADAAFNELQDEISLLQWDGERRLDDWLVKFALVEDTIVSRTVGRKWLIGAIARALDPGCKMDNVLVLEGAQGVGKSTMFKIIGGQWFADDIKDMNSKDASQAVGSCWILELAELSSLSHNEVEDVKRFISRTHEKYRPAYSEFEVTRPRQCVFGGTTNKAQYLIDETGNRRFWAVKVGGYIDTEGLASVRDQLLAEAKVAFEDGERWHITDPLVLQAISEHNKDRTVLDEWQSEVRRIVGVDASKTWSLIDLWGRMGGSTDKLDKRAQNRLGAALRAIGFENRTVRVDGEVQRRWCNTSITDNRDLCHSHNVKNNGDN